MTVRKEWVKDLLVLLQSEREGGREGRGGKDPRANLPQTREAGSQDVPRSALTRSLLYLKNELPSGLKRLKNRPVGRTPTEQMMTEPRFEETRAPRGTIVDHLSLAWCLTHSFLTVKHLFPDFLHLHFECLRNLYRH